MIEKRRRSPDWLISFEELAEVLKFARFDFSSLFEGSVLAELYHSMSVLKP